MPEVHTGSKRDLVNAWKENPTQAIKYKDACSSVMGSLQDVKLPGLRLFWENNSVPIRAAA